MHQFRHYQILYLTKRSKAIERISVKGDPNRAICIIFTLFYFRLYTSCT